MDVRREWAPGEMEDAQRIGLVYAKRPWPGFEWAVQEYRQIEAEIVAREGEDEFMVLETKRRIAEWILTCANRDNVPFERFQEAWNELLALGFTDGYKQRHMTFLYADYCLTNKLYDLGLGVFEPVIVEFEEWLQSRVLKKRDRAEYNQELANMKLLRDGLIAFRTGEAEAKAWLELRKAHFAARKANPDPYANEPWGLREDLCDAMKPVASSWGQGFAEIARQYRQVETDFLAALKNGDDFFVPETRCRISSAILEEAHKHRQPFDVCQELWNEVQRGVFQDLEHRCDATWSYANCCLINRQFDAGLTVVEPLLAELHRHLDAGTDTEMDPERYPEEIARFDKLRDDLKAISQ